MTEVSLLRAESRTFDGVGCAAVKAELQLAGKHLCRKYWCPGKPSGQAEREYLGCFYSEESQLYTRLCKSAAGRLKEVILYCSAPARLNL